VKAYYSISKARRKSGARIFQIAYFTFLACGVCALTYASYIVADAHAYQAIEQSRFESASRIKASLPAIAGGAMGEMEVPRLGMKAIFVQGDSPKILRRAVGHIAGTAMPGEPGNVVLTGHRDTFFRPLRNIQKGDAITIRTLHGEFQYRVDSTQVVLPSDVQVLQPSSDNTLTLVTCFPFYYVGPAPKRFIVRARQIGPLPSQSAGADAPLNF
jgi:sortase A